MNKLIINRHLPPTSAINLAYKRVSFLFSIFAIVDKAPKQTMMNIIEKKNFKIYEFDVSVAIKIGSEVYSS